jgi:hypothetical protein
MSGDEIILTELEELLLHNVKRSAVPGRHAGRNAVIHFQKAWALRDIDPTMAVFRLLTATEESATAIFHALKLRNYAGASRLRPYDHGHKAAMVPFLNAVEHSLVSLQELRPSIILAKKAKRPRAQIAFQFTAPDGKPYTARPEPPLHGVYTRDGVQHDFQEELALLTDSKHKKGLVGHIQELANERNRLLYASSQGILQVGAIKQFYFDRVRREIFRNLGAYLLIVEYKEHQDFNIRTLFSRR